MKIILSLLIVAFGLVSVSAQTIRTGQTLQISITGVPVAEKGRLDAVYSVSDSGYINMWMIGSVKASGMTKDALARSIAAKYKAAEIYTNPVFQVFSGEDAKAQDNQFFTVGGQVRSPGQKQWTNGMTLYSAIQGAGGETPYAAMNRVKLYRNGQAYVYDMKRQDHKGVKIYSRDVIEVPEGNLIGR
ncbi:polysaccharide biosynthesis/export family protein [Akkermansiaceae bacterium]|jgi:polysaccharide export outer membrane protein|nr:polysaccharide biosynthesis/export family protein [Akkermansiaceae bacterium]MDA9830120.1 polysaccharide biosynthesis/export family protein [Akkermansiaceae bacterium]MDB4382956.1 polysaccharide biosynthesis/export family protein [Akkermansiaceae bacterium]MDB4422376.1 polysaccharide biosynthesis/export family protein [bacterium]MDB4809395.1 polysaccharide biosynthesis/export family protein [bacterium]